MLESKEGRFALIAYLAFLALAAFTGGSSHYDAPSQLAVRTGAVVLIAALLLRRSERAHPFYRPAYLLGGSLAALILIQLIPLPPALWSLLPGRTPYLEAASAAGVPQPWRPINLTPDRGWNTFYALLPPAAALLAASSLRRRDQSTVLFAWIAIVIVSAVMGLAQISGGEDDVLRLYAAPPSGSAVGLFANRNHQALLIATGLPMLAVWVDRAMLNSDNRRIQIIMAIAGGFFLILMIPTTGSRMGLVLAALSLLLSIAICWDAIRRGWSGASRLNRLIAGGAAALLTAGVLAIALTFSRAEAVHRLFKSDPAEDARAHILRPLLAMVTHFMPVGTGFGSFDPVYRGFEPFDNLAMTFMNQAHNDYLQLALEGGLPAIALLLIFLGWWARLSFRHWTRSVGEEALLGRLGSIILVLIFLASTTDYPVRTPLIMLAAVQSAVWMFPRPARQSRRTNDARGVVNAT